MLKEGTKRMDAIKQIVRSLQWKTQKSHTSWSVVFCILSSVHNNQLTKTIDDNEEKWTTDELIKSTEAVWWQDTEMIDRY